MKILILITATHEEPWDKLIQSGKDTWDSIKHPDVQTIYVYGGSAPGRPVIYNGKEELVGQDYYAGVLDHYDFQHIRYKRAFDFFWEWEWDFMVCGSSSSYFDKKLLYEKCLTLPKDRIYMGIDGGGMASGCGRIQSRDVTDILRKQIEEKKTHDEDGYMGLILQNNGIGVTPGAERVQYNYVTNKIKRCYHYRCKNSEDRMMEIQAFKNIFNESCFGE